MAAARSCGTRSRRQFDIKPILRASTGPQMGGWFRSEINTLDDYQGLKFRMPGLGGEVMRRLGATVVNLPGGEIFPALQAGTIDGTEWVGPWHDLAFGFYKVAQFYYWPGWHEPGTTGEVMINRQAWEGLTKERAGDVPGRDRGRGLAGVRRDQRPERRLAQGAGRGARRRSCAASRTSCCRRSAGSPARSWPRSAASDPLTPKVYDSYMDFREQSVGWAGDRRSGLLQRPRAAVPVRLSRGSVSAAPRLRPAAAPAGAGGRLRAGARPTRRACDAPRTPAMRLLRRLARATDRANEWLGAADRLARARDGAAAVRRSS